MRKLENLLLPATLVLIILLHGVSLCAGASQGKSIRSDGHGYYAWLPALLLDGDPSFQTLVEKHYSQNPNVAGLTLVKATERYASKYSIGVAVMQLPGFALAHLTTHLMHNPQRAGWEPYHFPADGYSLFYQLAVAGSGMMYAMLGLLLLRRMLKKRFPEGVVSLTLIAVIFGTSWLHYASIEASMSHGYSFFLFAAFLSVLLRWRESSRASDFLLLGLISGMIALVRLPNLLVWVAVPFLLPGTLQEKLKNYWKPAFIVLGVTTLMFFPQMLLWRYATGEWAASGYAAHDEGFFWLKPQIAQVLVGIKKGLFFYAPVLLFAVAGWCMRSTFRWASLAVFVPATYLISSWHMWWFGGSFGHRAFIEFYVFLAFPMAVALQKLWTHSRNLAFTVVFLCCSWTLWWMKMYNTREYDIEGLDFQALYDIFYLRWHMLRALIGL